MAMFDSQQIADQFFTDCERDNRSPNPENLRAWLWFSCPAQLRSEIEELILRDKRYSVSREKTIRFRLTEEEKAAISKSAEDAGMTVSQFIRSRVL